MYFTSCAVNHSFQSGIEKLGYQYGKQRQDQKRFFSRCTAHEKTGRAEDNDKADFLTKGSLI
jgi:hypothetical protein